VFSTTEIHLVFTLFVYDFEQEPTSKEHTDIYSNSRHFNASDMGIVVTNTPSDTLSSYGVWSIAILYL